MHHLNQPEDLGNRCLFKPGKLAKGTLDTDHTSLQRKIRCFQAFKTRQFYINPKKIRRLTRFKILLLLC